MTRLLITRPAAGAGALAELLEAAGFETVAVPTIAIAPPNEGSLERALARIGQADWLIVTSANAVPALAGRVPASVRVAAVGPTTERALLDAGIRVDRVPADYRSAALPAALGEIGDCHVLLAHADAAAPELRAALIERGARVTEGIAYRTIEGPPSSRQPLLDALNGHLDGIVFSSGSAVRGLLALLDATERERARALPALCIGPVTAAEATAHGFETALVADEHTAAGLAEAIVGRLRTEAIA